MPKYQLFKDGILVNTIEAEQSFIDEIASEYDTITQVADNLVSTPSEVPVPLTISDIAPTDLLMLFTAQERISIRSSAKTDALLEDFLSILNDPRTTIVNISSLSEIFIHLVELEILTQDRVIQITHGKRADEPQVVVLPPSEIVPYMTGQEQAQAEVDANTPA